MLNEVIDETGKKLSGGAKKALRNEQQQLKQDLGSQQQPGSQPSTPIVPQNPPQYKKKKSGLIGKEAASNVPSWAQGERPMLTENGKQFAKRLLDGKYGIGNYPTGPGSEFNQIKKWGDRAFD